MSRVLRTLTLLLSALCAEANLGFNIAMDGSKDQLSVADTVKAIVKAYPALTGAKTFTHQVHYLEAFAEAGIKRVIAGVDNRDLTKVSGGGMAAEIADLLAPFTSGMDITIAMGNECNREDQLNQGALKNVGAAMKAMRKALKAKGLSGVKVSTPLVWLRKSFGDESLQGIYKDAIQGMAEENGVFMANLYPFHVLREGSSTDVDKMLLKSPVESGGVSYEHEFAKDLADLRTMLTKFGAPKLPIVITETGWATADDPVANVKYATEYINNVATYAQKNGIEVYFFEGVDEPRKAEKGGHFQGKMYENHFGLITEHGKKKISCPILEKGGAASTTASPIVGGNTTKPTKPASTALKPPVVTDSTDTATPIVQRPEDSSSVDAFDASTDASADATTSGNNSGGDNNGDNNGGNSNGGNNNGGDDKDGNDAPTDSEGQNDDAKYPECQSKMAWMKEHWQQESWYKEQGVDGSECSFQRYLAKERGGPYCAPRDC